MNEWSLHGLGSYMQFPWFLLPKREIKNTMKPFTCIDCGKIARTNYKPTVEIGLCMDCLKAHGIPDERKKIIA